MVELELDIFSRAIARSIIAAVGVSLKPASVNII